MSVWSRSNQNRTRLLTYFMAFLAVFITMAMVKYSKDAFDSALNGLHLWWDVVFPSLLPFFVLSEILMGLGVVDFIGVLLEPLMRPLFNVPGVGAFALSMGLASGYPMDAVITCRFRENRMCSAVEAERLLSFTNTADPLFMFGAVAVGMFGMPELGVIIALAHYLASFLVGICYRFHGIGRDVPSPEAGGNKGNIIVRAFRELYRARQRDGRSLGELFGDSVKQSMQTILLIGGFIILFSVFLRIVSIIGLTEGISQTFAAILSAIGFSPNLAPSLVSGLFEIDIGTMAASQADAPLIEKVAIASAIIAWSGLSVHGQVASIVIKSGIRMHPYIFARLLHAVFAALLTVMFLHSGANVTRYLSIPVMLQPAGVNSIVFWLNKLEQICYQVFLSLVVLIILSVMLDISKKIYRKLSNW